MKQSLKTGLCFGVTSGIITTLGLMVGLTFSSNMKLVVIGGILTIAIADAFSDALGIHISQESDKKNNVKEVRESTITTFIAKFVMALTFIVPLLLLDLKTAVLVSTVWGLSILGILSYYIAKIQKEKPLHVILEHLIIGMIVIILTYFVGIFISNKFGN